jgi:tRNA 2-selenouridine synthase
MIAVAGLCVRRVEGGYKAMRRFRLEQLERQTSAATIYALSGRRASGKSRELGRCSSGLDLEGHAPNRPSSFGGLSVSQTSQIDFENVLTIDAMKIEVAAGARLLVADEGRIIGRLYLSNCLFDAMRHAPTIVLEVPLEVRVEHIPLYS